MAETKWDPGQYARFADERLRPGLDLIARLPDVDAARVVDLGCGTGELTARLAARFPGATTVGVDNSAAMLEKARAIPGITWETGDIATWGADPPVDVLFANAAYMWVPNHEALMPRLFAQVRPGGVFAWQMPNNFMEPSHRLMRATAAAGPWADTMRAARSIPALPKPESYVDWLKPFAAHVDMWETRYFHVLSGVDPVVEWVKGTGLRPFLDTLSDPDQRAAYLKAYATSVAEAYPTRADGTTIYPFPRLFLVAVRA